ncbi:MAG TPA: hypothetical protein VMV22_05925 [Acidimicrobiales bacterium]|nr:hypothetical protein [Acidimicrobiales bacterium]
MPVLRRWRPLVLFTVVEMGVPWFVLFRAERHVSSSVTAVIATVPLFGAVVARTTGSHGVDARKVAGLLLGGGSVFATRPATGGRRRWRRHRWPGAAVDLTAPGRASHPPARSWR